MKQNLFQIRDESDYPILYTAILEDVDILITGDKDFLDIEIERPEILTPAQFFCFPNIRIDLHKRFVSRTKLILVFWLILFFRKIFFSFSTQHYI